MNNVAMPAAAGLLVLAVGCGVDDARFTGTDAAEPDAVLVDAPGIDAAVDAAVDARTDDPLNCGAPGQTCPEGTCVDNHCVRCARTLAQPEMFVPHGYDGVTGIPGFRLSCPAMPPGPVLVSFSGTIVASPGAPSNEAGFYLCAGRQQGTGPCDAVVANSNYRLINGFNTTTAFSFTDVRFAGVADAPLVANLVEYYCHPGPCGVTLQPGATIEVRTAP